MSGRHAVSRMPRYAGLVGLAAALFAAGWLLFAPQPADRQPARGAPGVGTSVPDLWPAARIVKSPGRLADGRAYTPWFHVNAEVSVGTALTGDGAATRLLVRGADGSARELMRAPSADNPQFNGLTAAGDDLLWMVSSGEAGAKSTLYRADWRRGDPAVRLTANTGDVIYYNSQYDLVVADGRVHWAVARADEQATEIRSMPVRGGPLSTQRVDGAYALSAWPWLTSAGTSQSGPVELRNLATGQRITVAGSPDEVVTCGPVWCRVLVLGPNGQPARTDLMHPDGSARVRVAAGAITSTVLDVALVDRFEVLSVTAAGDATTKLKLILYDAKNNRSALLADGVSTVDARGPVVWWSTGENEADAWYALDLRTLT